MIKKIMMILFLCAAPTAFCEGVTKKILVIESYSGDYQWDKSYKEGLEAILGKSFKIEYFELNTKKLPESEHQARANLAFEKYKSMKPDLIILCDDAALKYLGEKMKSESIPVVYLGINNNPRNYFKSKQIPRNITGVLERPLLKRSFHYNKLIYPSAQNALILFDTDLTAKVVKTEMFDEKDSMNLSGIKTD